MDPPPAKKDGTPLVFSIKQQSPRLAGALLSALRHFEVCCYTHARALFSDSLCFSSPTVICCGKKNFWPCRGLKFVSASRRSMVRREGLYADQTNAPVVESARYAGPALHRMHRHQYTDHWFRHHQIAVGMVRAAQLDKFSSPCMHERRELRRR